jgi:hypothetical protein
MTDEKPRGSGLVITDHKGVQITFDNGITVSIQWGPGNYCGDYWKFNQLDKWDAPKKSRFWESPNAEVAIFWANKSGEWLTKEACSAVRSEEAGDDVLAAVSPADVVRYLAWAAAHAPAEPSAP